jgi:diguanylate cyclase (GGDEF)-like protein
MRPRDPESAARAVFVLSAVAATVTAVSGMLPQAGYRSITVLVVMLPVLAALVAVTWLLRRVRRVEQPLWTVIPPLSICLVVALDLLTRDASIAAQIFLLFPALYAASQLPRVGAVTVTGLCAAADAVVVFSQQPLRLAIVNATYVCAALATVCLLLVRAAERNDELLARLRRQVAMDPLTGLATRRVLDSAAEAALAGADSDEGTALIVLDIDHFKAVNDSYGHPGGDDVLVQLAEILTRHCRPGDVVSRLGGDELAMLLVGMPLAGAQQRAELIRDEVAAHHFRLPDETLAQLTLSAGVAHAPSHAVDLQRLYAAADASLYRAKRSGRNRVVVPDRTPAELAR